MNKTNNNNNNNNNNNSDHLLSILQLRNVSAFDILYHGSKIRGIFHAPFKIKSLFTISNRVAICEFIYQHLKEEIKKGIKNPRAHAKDIETIQDK